MLEGLAGLGTAPASAATGIGSALIKPGTYLNKGKKTMWSGRKFLSEEKWVEASYTFKNVFDDLFDPKNIEWKILNSIHLKGV